MLGGTSAINFSAKGPLPVSFHDVLGPFNVAWMETFKALGYHLPGDPIAGEKLGVFQNPLSVDPKTGNRAHSASAYYNQDVAKRPNLTVLTNALVEKVLFDTLEDEKLMATGIQYSTDGGGERQVINTRREVIIAAGTIKSPQLLELSGIGGKDLLNKYDIPVLIDNPQVGENLQDHVLASISFDVDDIQVSGDILRDPCIVESVYKLYQETNGGP